MNRAYPRCSTTRVNADNPRRILFNTDCDKTPTTEKRPIEKETAPTTLGPNQSSIKYQPSDAVNERKNRVP